MELDPILLIASIVLAQLIGAGTLGVVILRLTSNPELKDSVEKMLYNSVSKEVLETVNTLASYGNKAFTFVEEVTDNEPNEKTE